MARLRFTTLALILALSAHTHAASAAPDAPADSKTQAATSQKETSRKVPVSQKDELRILPDLPTKVAGELLKYRTREGDSIGKLASTYGVDSRVLALLLDRKIDDLWAPDLTPLPPGRRLLLDTRHIVPTGVEDGLIISVSQRRIYLFREGSLVQSHLIAAGHPLKPTPRGRFRVTEMKKDKPWIVPLSVQQEMREYGEEVKTVVQPGPDNPLGTRWIRTSLPDIGVHGTIEPYSISRYESHGCIRMHNADVESLFEKVELGDKGLMLYAPVLMAKADDGTIYLEVHSDRYEQDPDPEATIRQWAETHGLTDAVDWNKVAQVIQARDGAAHVVGLGQEDPHPPLVKTATAATATTTVASPPVNADGATPGWLDQIRNLWQTLVERIYLLLPGF